MAVPQARARAAGRARRLAAALLWLAVACLAGLATPARAHKPSDSYLSLRVDGARLTGQWDIALRDLEYAIGLDANGDGEITWGEVKSRHGDIASYALARLDIRSGAGTEGGGAPQPCPLKVIGHLLDDHSDGAYAVLRLEAGCPAAPSALTLRYRLFFDFDAQHKGLLRLEARDAALSGVFAADRAEQHFDLARITPLGQFLTFTREGIWHIWIGFDHILFILSLLLPAVLLFASGAWRPAPRFAPAFWDVLRVVTSFTVAHSITLSLAALGAISLPSRLVESTIAASVVLAALNNLRPLVQRRRWVVAFVFGLIHGFGFASVLADLGLPENALFVALAGFNAGVEIGQLAIVSAFLPLAFALRGSWFYRRLLMTGGSLAVAAVALAWFIERAFDLKLMGGG